MSTLTCHCPAKLNLFLAVTGRRADGFHELVSVVSTVDFGDTLTVEPRADGVLTLACDAPGVPTDGDNLVLKAAHAFRAATGWQGGAHFTLTKRIPAGAGLGGGSSDAATALSALNRLAGEPLSDAALAEVAAAVGSDCSLFLHRGPLIMRGRGERIESLPEPAAQRLRGQRVLILKPPFGVNTAWAYACFVAGAPNTYWPAERAEAHLKGWITDGSAPAEALCANNFEAVVFGKQVVLPVLVNAVREQHGLITHMSGSGSACFLFLPPDCATEPIRRTISAVCGPHAFVQETQLSH